MYKWKKFILWALVVVLLIGVGCCACWLWPYILEDPGEPYREVEGLFAEPYEAPLPPPNPTVVDDGKLYFEADGIRFEMPYGFEPEYADAYGPQPGPHFDYYFRSYERNAIIRVRRTTGGVGPATGGAGPATVRAGSADALELETYAKLYVAMGAGVNVGEAKIARIAGEDLKAIRADAGTEALYILAAENQASWGYFYEYVIFLGKEPAFVWTVSLALITLDEVDAELMRKTIRGGITLID